MVTDSTEESNEEIDEWTNDVLQLAKSPETAKNQYSRNNYFSDSPPFGRFSELQTTKSKRINPLISHGTVELKSRKSLISPFSPLIDEHYPDLDDDISKLSVLMKNYFKKLDNTKL